MAGITFVFLTILLIVSCVNFSNASTTGAAQGDILHTILDGYDTRVLPKNTSAPVIVEVGLALQQIISVDQKTQVLKLAIWMRQYWNDPRLTWNPSDYYGTDIVYIPSSQHWKPDILFYENADDEQPQVFEQNPTAVYSSGDVTFMYPATISATCPQNVKNFPMDIQRCPLKFGSWSMGGDSLMVKAHGSNAADFNSEQSKQNGEWEIIDFFAVEHKNYYGCCAYPFYDIEFTLVIKRHWKMIFIYLYIPNIVVNVLTIFQFLLPSDSSERCTLGITIFLSIIVYLLLLNGVLPNSDDIPIIISYMSTTLILNGISQVCNICILWLHFSGLHDNHTPLPSWARELILHKMAGYLGMGKFITSDIEHEGKLQSYKGVVTVEEDDDEEIIEVQDLSQVSNMSMSKSSLISGRNRICIEPADCSSTLKTVHVEDSPASKSVHFEDSKSSLSPNATTMKLSTGLLVPHQRPSLKISISIMDHGKNTNSSSNKNDKISDHVVKTELEGNEEILTFQILQHLDDYKAERIDHGKDSELKCEWMQAAMVISRLLLYIYIVITIIMSGIVMGASRHHYNVSRALYK